jgi:hypothetical protein
MGEPKIPGGYVIKARIIKTKSIHRMPPYVREIWDYCLREANHEDAIHKGNTIKRGQLFRQYKEIREDLCWYVGYRKMMYNENHTKKAMKALREAGMIDTTKALGGVLITVLNYDFYQDPKNYERTSEITNESTTKEPMENQGIPDNNKKNKNEKNKEIKTSKKFDDDSQEMKICRYFYSVLLRSDPKLNEPNWQNWCKDIDLFLRKIKPTREEIKQVIDYAHDPVNSTDKFSWIPNLRSPKKLREHFKTILLQSKQRKSNGKIKAKDYLDDILNEGSQNEIVLSGEDYGQI